MSRAGQFRMIRGMGKPVIVGLALAGLFALAACGGGGDDPPSSFTPPASGAIPYTPGVYLPYSSFAAQCQNPRSGNDPETGRRWPDRQGSVAAENHWLRAWTRDLYLWYREVPDIDPASVATTAAYFDLMQTSALLPSGQRKDRFHFSENTDTYRQRSGSGVSVGYGIQWRLVRSTPPRQLLVEFVEPGSPAATAGVRRGDEALIADGVDVVNGLDVATLNAALFPQAGGVAHQIVFRDRDNGSSRAVSLTPGQVTLDPVPVSTVLTTPTGNVGYLLFNDHIAPAEAALVDAVTALRAANVQDVILDLRYNGGGFLSIASQLAYMIAGPANTAGRTFERLQFNDQHPITDPVTGQPLTPLPFLNTTRGLSLPQGQVLPTLNLSRVYVLTSADTCSASESFINGLRGIGLTVHQIGPDTCGKPYGFYPEDNCGTTYFSIQFKGVNAAGFGDYFEGFSATRTDIDPQARLPGCPARDDLRRDLGDPAEDQLRVALVYRESGLCTATAPAEAPLAAAPGAGPALVLPPRESWRENRILR